MTVAKKPKLYCKYCERDYPASAASYEENPFCSECLHERMEKARLRYGRGRKLRFRVIEPHYLEAYWA